MRVLLYNEVKPNTIPGFAKLRKHLEEDDFKSAEVKKVGDNLYRARLNRNDRLLLSIHRHQGKAYALILEHIKNHAYEDSRFLRRGATIDEDRIQAIRNLDQVTGQELVYLNPNQGHFNLLDKIISFDERQQSIYDLQPPLIVIGPAGSGKTALTLEKMKHSIGDVLYVTQSPYLVENSRDLYYSNDYDNPNQQVDFLSFQELLESIKVPAGKPVTFQRFQQWFSRFRQGGPLKDGHKLFEEFRGVITGPATDKSWRSRDEYLALGIKESIFLVEEREAVYSLFEKYLDFLRQNELYDSNIVSHDYLQFIEPRYDFVIVDEVQDLTNVQLYLIVRSLRQAQDFILCGDSNQIVHPNFFSWSKIKTLFYQQKDIQTSAELIRVLSTNYRNSPQVTEIANRILKIKRCRFGSIDKESHYLVESNGHTQGDVLFLHDNDKIKQELDTKTRTSTQFAVIVMTEEQKPRARSFFGTPLVFTIQEAKGLEYGNIILFNFLSEEESRYREICKGVDQADLEQEILYSRARDKTDKSLEVYKFYINALYVALTRAISTLYWIESNPRQPLLDLLGLRDAHESLEMADQASSLDDWSQEAHKLELQGKQEQADRIRSEVLKQKTPDWEVLTPATLPHVRQRAFEENNKKARLALFEYALIYEDRGLFNELMAVNFKPAQNPERGLQLLQQNHYSDYTFKKPDAALKQANQYGPDYRNVFNQTPLMVAAWVGNVEVIKGLHALGADTEKVDGNGLTAFQIALAQAAQNESFAQKKLSEIYELLEPTSMSVQVDGRLVKLDKHSMEFFMLNLMMALFYRVMPSKLTLSVGGFRTQDFLDAIWHIPNSTLAERRKKRAYLSSILSKNEVDRDDKYNRKLFFRIVRGGYIPNPNLSVRIEGEWVNVYSLLSIDRLARQQHDKNSWQFQFNDSNNRHMEFAKASLKEIIAKKLSDYGESG